MSKNWAEEELSGINLGDERLNKRSKSLLATLGEKPPPVFRMPVTAG
ncbi:IS4/Tn5 family transposase DNA-binding protein [Glaciimonas immobilis]|uniref:Transposase Tn5-like N-terminal domain-containing protein n=1 Tax=Glaciimonas immobilis TaxID=728004 RepID=A0A840RS73_9BURK|nr:transposase DNA-binding-containing protein [Glaciimonas immobilis]KAF3997021.1 hypothetical protein HAV38_15195 [Glaciimonas immobilis]MBB5199858.1 hypothetical protein [Glaciimonas immobilis]